MQEAIVIRIQNRLKEFRWEKKPVKKPVSMPWPAVAALVTVVSKQLMKQLEIEAGEDERSYERFTAQIHEELKKKKPRPELCIFFDSVYE